MMYHILMRLPVTGVVHNVSCPKSYVGEVLQHYSSGSREQ